MAETYTHQSSSSSSEDSEAEVRIIAKNVNISVYKFNRRPLNYPYHAYQLSIRISRLTNVNPPYGLLPSTWVFSRPTGNTVSHSTLCMYWFCHLYWYT